MVLSLYQTVLSLTEKQLPKTETHGNQIDIIANKIILKTWVQSPKCQLRY